MVPLSVLIMLLMRVCTINAQCDFRMWRFDDSGLVASNSGWTLVSMADMKSGSVHDEFVLFMASNNNQIEALSTWNTGSNCLYIGSTCSIASAADSGCSALAAWTGGVTYTLCPWGSYTTIAGGLQGLSGTASGATLAIYTKECTGYDFRMWRFDDSGSVASIAGWTLASMAELKSGPVHDEFVSFMASNNNQIEALSTWNTGSNCLYIGGTCSIASAADSGCSALAAWTGGVTYTLCPWGSYTTIDGGLQGLSGTASGATLAIYYKVGISSITQQPTPQPTNNPTPQPTAQPTSQPTSQPTPLPTSNPTKQPTNNPTSQPTPQPTSIPTVQPTPIPTSGPSIDPTIDPTADPTSDPTSDPSIDPTIDPTFDPTYDPTSDPSIDPTIEPTSNPTVDPTVNPTSDPTNEPTTQIPSTRNPSYHINFPTRGGIETTPNDGEVTEPQKTTLSGEQSTASKAEKHAASNIFENKFGEFWYLTLAAVVFALCCCFLALCLLWRRKRKSNKENVANIGFVEGNPTIEMNATHMARVASTSNISYLPSPLTPTTPPTGNPLDAIDGYFDNTSPVPVESPKVVNNNNNNMFAAVPMPIMGQIPLGVMNNNMVNMVLPAMPIINMNVPFNNIGNANITDGGDTCGECGMLTDGKKDNDGNFYCFQCWMKWTNTEDDGENDSDTDEELFRNDNNNNDQNQPQYTPM